MEEILILNIAESLKYYEDENYREKINKKISLDLSYCDNITDVSILGSIYTLYLSNCSNIKDVRFWRNSIEC